MRKFFVVSRQLLAVGCMLIANAAIAQSGYYTRYFGDEALQQKADAWTASEVWRNGFNAAMPHESVNRIDFYQQYEKNPEQWKALCQDRRSYAPWRSTAEPGMLHQRQKTAKCGLLAL